MDVEHLCVDCDEEICRRPRDGLEATLCAIESDGLSRSAFLRRYAFSVTGPTQDTEGWNGRDR